VIRGILLFALGCGETQQVTPGSGAQKQLPKETLQQIVRLSNMAGPWAPSTPTEVRLRKRLFDYEDERIRAGERVVRAGARAERAADVLSVETTAPNTTGSCATGGSFTSATYGSGASPRARCG